MKKLKELKKLFFTYKIDGYIIPKNDEFFGEYIPKTKDNLKFISNFSGSYGFALILKKDNYLFVDGRYTLQAKIQSGKIFNIITLPNKLPSNVLKGKKLSLGFDPKLHTETSLDINFKSTKIKLIPLDENLVNKIRKKKMVEKAKKFYTLKNKDTGQSSKNKITKLSKLLYKNKIDFQFVSSSENVAWVLNLRGGDSEFSPIPNSYLIINKKNKVYFFCDLKKVSKKLRRKFQNSITIINIKNIESFISRIENKKFQLDSLSCSMFFKNIIKKNNKILKKQDPIYLLKSIKNKVEIKNTTKAHIFDGVALAKFLLGLNNNCK